MPKHHPGPGPRTIFLEGVLPGTAGQIALPNSGNALILRNPLLEPQYDQVRMVIRLPRPSIIRHYCGTEVSRSTLKTNPATDPAIVRVPQVIHEVTVFSYFHFYKPRFTDHLGAVVPIHKQKRGPFWDIGFYSQPAEACVSDDSDIFNNMFHLKNTNTKIQIDMSLQGLGCDLPPIRTVANVGID